MAITKGGIAFTFYDSFRWSGFNSYYPEMQKVYPNWKATFFADKWPTLSSTVKNQMLAAQSAGIQIGNHQYLSTPATTYLSTHTQEEFWTNMVELQQTNMIASGITPPTVFAVAGGGGMPPRTLYNLIISKGSAIKLVMCYGGGIYSNPAKSHGYYKSFFTEGLGGIGHLDTNSDSERASFDLDYIISQLDYCKANNDVYIHSGHTVQATPVSPAGLTNLHSTIQKLSHYIVQKKMAYYTMNDLIDAGFIGSENALPNVFINSLTGTFSSGNNLTASYIYHQDTDIAESGTTFQWYRADDAQGTNAAAIAGATSLVYTLVAGDSGKYVRIGITPRTASETGYETFTKWYAIS